MRYRPKLRNGDPAPLPWHLEFFLRFNNICWPLEDDDASRWVAIFDRLCYAIAFLIYIQHLDAEIRYLVSASNDIHRFLDGVPPFLLLNEVFFRVFELGLRRADFKHFLRRFYAEIYIERSSHPTMFDRHIQRKLRLIDGFAIWICRTATMALYLTAPVVGWFHRRRDLPFNMIYPFDHTPLHIYVPLLGSNVWVAMIAAAMVIDESYILANVMVHLNARYLLLTEDLQRSSQQLLQMTLIDVRNDPHHHHDHHHHRSSIAQQLGAELKCIMQRNVELNEFAAEFQQFFSYRVFIMFIFAAILLCTLSFKVYTNIAGSISSFFWMISKVVELLVIGAVGSTLIATTDDISSMFYLHSNWELIIFHSPNTLENIQLMKLLTIAMETSRKPFVLTGLGFVGVSLTAVLKILEGAASYFTCLISFR